MTFRGSFAYITGVLPGGDSIPLFRLRYGGSAHSFSFAIYSPPAAATKTPSCSPASHWNSSRALDTACTVHLAGIGHQPSS